MRTNFCRPGAEYIVLAAFRGCDVHPDTPPVVRFFYKTLKSRYTAPLRAEIFTREEWLWQGEWGWGSPNPPSAMPLSFVKDVVGAMNDQVICGALLHYLYHLREAWREVIPHDDRPTLHNDPVQLSQEVDEIYCMVQNRLDQLRPRGDSL